jgi:hypothetical protein
VRTLIPLVLFALAGFFVLESGRGVELPIPGPSGVKASDLHLGPPRQALQDPPQIQNGAFRQTCSECHALFPSPEVPRSPLLQHVGIVLNHGLNDRCYNCHALENRDLLVLRDGTTLGYGEVPRLCAQCHGTVYRDWQNGTHGRTNGYWDRTAGEPVRLSCTQCHDPHSPKYPRFVPLPGPNTLRMGAQDGGRESHAKKPNPLERWKAHAEGATSSVEPPPTR